MQRWQHLTSSSPLRLTRIYTSDGTPVTAYHRDLLWVLRSSHTRKRNPGTQGKSSADDARRNAADSPSRFLDRSRSSWVRPTIWLSRACTACQPLVRSLGFPLQTPMGKAAPMTTTIDSAPYGIDDRVMDFETTTRLIDHAEK